MAKIIPKRTYSRPEIGSNQGLEGLIHHFILVRTHSSAGGKRALAAKHADRFEYIQKNTTANARATFEVIKRHLYPLAEAPEEYLPEPKLLGKYPAPKIRSVSVTLTQQMVDGLVKKYPSEGRWSFRAFRAICEAVGAHQ